MSRSLLVLALGAALLSGCGEKPEPAASKVTAVTGMVDLARPAAAAPDAGTTAGHRAPATASTKRSSLAFGGRVKPATSTVTLRPARGAAIPVKVAADGSFRARARKLKKGRNAFVVEARSPGLADWKVDITIARK
jgi:hypothetical protein